MKKHIFVRGIVEEVGFRPIVFELATRLELQCWVSSTDAGMEILVQGTTSNIERFICALKTETFGLVQIDDLFRASSQAPVSPASQFHPPANAAGFDPSPLADVGICPDCERELFDSHARRYLYPFLSCRNCGPRFTTITGVPYQRSNTTMADFGPCDECAREFNDPDDRHFHDEQSGCPDCGPFLALREVRSPYPNSASKVSSIECRIAAILKARRLLREGYILSLKGLGGFQLVCDACNSFTVEELRDRQGHADQPFTVMAANLEVVRSICEVSSEEEELLKSREKPVVMLTKKQQQARKVSRRVAPNLDAYGVMLPPTPLHHLLLNQSDLLLASEPAPPLLVVTGGSVSDQPAAIENEAAFHDLSPLADAFLLHNLDIHMRCDDSVVRVEREPGSLDDDTLKSVPRPPSIVYLRRSRGYAPYTVKLPVAVSPVLAPGGEMKTTICAAQDRYAFMSPPIGDLKSEAAFEAFEQSIDHLLRISGIRPEMIAHDLDPNCFGAQYAQRIHLLSMGVQHQHAHIVSCMADHGVDGRRVIGLALDDSGYGTDGAVWGGEVLLTSLGDFERFAHLEYLPLPRSDSPIRHPWQVAVAYAHALQLPVEDLPSLSRLDKQLLRAIQQQVDAHLDLPMTSSMARLFDAVASLIGLRNEVTYGSQAAIELETLARPFVSVAQPYPYQIDEERMIRLQTLLQAIVQEIRAGKSIEIIAARFHRTIAAIALDICRRARDTTGLNEVALSGEMWQNQILLRLVREGLERQDFVAYAHRQVPANDGGLALGRAIIAGHARTAQAALADHWRHSAL